MTGSQFLVRFVQQHPTFRRSELESCAILGGYHLRDPLKFIEYDDSVPFALLEIPDELNPAALVKRSILTQ